MDTIIEQITSRKQLAVVGVSDKKFGGQIYKELRKRGYEVYPVHPERESFDGDRCYASLKDLPDNVTASVVAVAPKTALQIVEEAASSGITHLWFQQGKDFSEAVSLAESKGIKAVSKKCILMYAEPVTGIHGFHRFLARLFGKL